jgi:hypothetical protein
MESRLDSTVIGWEGFTSHKTPKGPPDKPIDASSAETFRVSAESIFYGEEPRALPVSPRHRICPRILSFLMLKSSRKEKRWFYCLVVISLSYCHWRNPCSNVRIILFFDFTFLLRVEVFDCFTNSFLLNILLCIALLILIVVDQGGHDQNFDQSRCLNFIAPMLSFCFLVFFCL